MSRSRRSGKKEGNRSPNRSNWVGGIESYWVGTLNQFCVDQESVFQIKVKAFRISHHTAHFGSAGGVVAAFQGWRLLEHWWPQMQVGGPRHVSMAHAGMRSTIAARSARSDYAMSTGIVPVRMWILLLTRLRHHPWSSNHHLSHHPCRRQTQVQLSSLPTRLRSRQAQVQRSGAPGVATAHAHAVAL